MKKLKKLSLKQMEQEMPVIFNQEQARYYGGSGFGWIQLTDPDPSFNCHSYAFNGGCGWLDDPTNLINGLYVETDSASTGDRIIYYYDSNNNNRYDTNEHIHHSGIVTSASNGNANRVTGKWGQLGIYESDVRGTPYDGIDFNNDGYWDTITDVAYLKKSW